jgi:hypothetical protein
VGRCTPPLSSRQACLGYSGVGVGSDSAAVWAVAEPTARRITGRAWAGCVGGSPRPGPHPAAVRGRRGRVREPSGTSHSACGSLGHPYGPLPRGGGVNDCAATDSNARGSPSEGPVAWPGDVVRHRGGPRLLPDSAVSRSPLQVGCRYLNWISSGSSGRALSGTLIPSVFWLSHRDRPGRGLQVRRTGRSRFQLSANNGQHGAAELADGVPRAVHRAGACRAVPGHEPDAARRACPFGQVSFAAAWPAACRPGHGYVDLAELAGHQYGPGFDSSPTCAVSRSASPALIATRT